HTRLQSGVQFGAEFDWSGVTSSREAFGVNACTPLFGFSCVRKTTCLRLMSKKGFMKTKSSRFDRLVARYYPAVYSFAARLTDDPRDAVALTREAFNGARKELQRIRNQTGIVTVLIAAVLRAGLASV